jgi:hypothetical protein
LRRAEDKGLNFVGVTMSRIAMRNFILFVVLAFFASSMISCKDAMKAKISSSSTDLQTDNPEQKGPGDQVQKEEDPIYEEEPTGDENLKTIKIVNVRRCSNNHTGWAIYNGIPEAQVQNLRFIVTVMSNNTFMRAFPTDNLMYGAENFGFIDGEFAKLKFENGKPRYPQVEGGVIAVQADKDILASIKKAASEEENHEAAFAVYYDKDNSGFLSKGDIIVGLNNGQPPQTPIDGDDDFGTNSVGFVDGKEKTDPLYEFQIMSIFYNRMQDGCHGDEHFVCEQCDELLSPLIVDLRGDGFALTNKEKGVFFDIEASGAKAKIGWTQGNSDEAFIALDRNANGIIDDGSELFGTATMRLNGLLAANGFDALVDLDTNADRLINQYDESFADLVLWLDRNHNGFSESHELHKLNKFVIEIDLNYMITNISDEIGNKIFAKSRVKLKNGKWRPLADVWFVTK